MILCMREFAAAQNCAQMVGQQTPRAHDRTLRMKNSTCSMSGVTVAPVVPVVSVVLRRGRRVPARLS